MSDGTYTYTYDSEGNRTSRTNIATGALTSYTWDARNRLVEVTNKTANPNSEIPGTHNLIPPLFCFQSIFSCVSPEFLKLL